ncbi:MAG: DUF998 domain-containing protein [Candidatus Heimdallarchaeota archaeon]|nr:DUF998 domain-containing protein [Candidatus Heimdallarchaeota archaeon]
MAICGMLAPIIYTVTWILGGFIVPEYNHIKKDVSSLFAVGAHKRWLFSSLFITGSALLFIFSFGLIWGIAGSSSIVGPILFLVSTFIGLIVAIFFPLDEGGELKTLRGKMHLILIVISGIAVMVSMIFLWLDNKTLAGWIGFAWFSLVSVPVLLILMVISGIFGGGPYMGLTERFMVSYFQIYYFVIALMVFINN